jgi:hypothetical protein
MYNYWPLNINDAGTPETPLVLLTGTPASLYSRIFLLRILLISFESWTVKQAIP